MSARITEDPRLPNGDAESRVAESLPAHGRLFHDAYNLSTTSRSAKTPAGETAFSSPPLDYAIHTNIVTDGGAKQGWLEIAGDKIIGIAGNDESPKAKNVIEYSGYAYPGLIDTHNHVDWNAIPRWTAGHDWQNRYEWMADPDYQNKVDGDHKPTSSTQPGSNLKNEAIAYGEIRALTDGTTILQSPFFNSPPDLLTRQLGPNYKADAWTLNVDKMPPRVQDELLNGLKSGKLDRAFFHVAEGQRQDGETDSEFGELRKQGFVRPGTVVIHGDGLTPSDFAEMKQNGMYLVWSPQSNLNLYGQTTDIKAANDAGLTISLAPDWTITGSNNLLEELKAASDYAKEQGLQDTFTPKRLFDMVTSDAAKVAGVDDELGKLAPGYGADVLLLSEKSNDPYQNLIDSKTSDVSLVFVKGKPVYGDPSILKPLTPNAETIDVAGIEKAVDTKDSNINMSYAQIVDDLSHAMPTLAPLHEGTV